MRIGITCYPTYGGSGIVATELGLELSLRGHEVHFISYANPVRLEGRERIFYHEVEVATYPLFLHPPYTLALASRMVDVAEHHGLDLLHVHYAIPHSVSAYLARNMMRARRRLPFVTTLHGTDITLVGIDPSYFPITQFSIEESDAVTAISQDLKDQTQRVFGIQRPIDVIHNFICPGTYRPRPEAREARPTLIHISNFRPVKRVLDCVRILAQVRESVDADLWMVGDGPDRVAAERLARELGVEAHVRFWGKQDQIPTLLPRAHVLLMPSEMESFGLAALEAMSCGLVPVATRVGGVPELIDDGRTGFLSAVGDVASQASAATRLLQDPALYATMAAAARHAAETRFNTNEVIPQYEAIYERVVG
ncbi:MAG: N-acetyl-alpha-D-glucosaminyl L-malate synthase BshA [Bryobacteraceae bacterium]|nr:N-acetyl-alpha-D-glucosaminyl L-malate synthase BshA [Bryobacteraceae bacterium]